MAPTVWFFAGPVWIGLLLAAQLVLVLRLKYLAREGRLQPDAKAYFSPVIRTGFFSVIMPWDLAAQQMSRMRDGRMLALLLTGRHREVNDGWISGIVYAQRGMLGLWLALLVGFALRR